MNDARIKPLSYDPACEELARHFLPSTASDRLAKELAQAIQEAVEDWMEDEAERLAGGVSEPVKQ